MNEHLSRTQFSCKKLLKQIANEILERTTGGKDSGLEPEDTNKCLL